MLDFHAKPIREQALSPAARVREMAYIDDLPGLGNFQHRSPFSVGGEKVVSPERVDFIPLILRG
jgi:hypothetical protein